VDRVRQQQMPREGPTLDYLGMLDAFVADLCITDLIPRALAEEAFTSENWIVS
jgi:hypothetical protein